MPPMPPRSAPGGARSGPKGAKEPPEASQEHPKSRPRGKKKEAKKDYHFRFRSWEGSGRPPGVVLKRFGSDFGASGVAL